MLQFYCRDCETTFNSEPDGSGYDQAPCPTCGELCMTVEFEQADRARLSDQATVFSFFSGLLGSFLFLCWDFLRGRPQTTGPEDGERPAMPALVAAATLPTLDEADECAALLNGRGIRAIARPAADADPLLRGPARGAIIQVPFEDLEAAHRILAERDAGLRESHSAQAALGPVTFLCDGCGAEITFGADRRGHVEACPRCGEFVDVPD